LKQPVARQLLALPDNAAQTTIFQLDEVTNAAVSLEAEPQCLSLHTQVPVPAGGEAERAVFARVFVIADSYVSGF
jgi:hypothetical protein